MMSVTVSDMYRERVRDSAERVYKCDECDVCM